MPSAKSAGFDAEFAFSISDNFDVAATASYNDAKLTSSLKDAAGLPIQGLADGNRLPTVPKFQTSVSVGYNHEGRQRPDRVLQPDLAVRRQALHPDLRPGGQPAPDAALPQRRRDHGDGALLPAQPAFL